MRAVLSWLRGEPKHCNMAAIPTVAEEDARRPTRERETLIREQTRAVNRIRSALIRFGAAERSRQSISERLECFCNAHIFCTQADVSARQTNLCQASADRRLSGNERRSSGRAALLTVLIGEQRAFLRDTVDVRRFVSHNAVVVRAYIEPADVVSHDHWDVRLAPGGCWLCLRLPRLRPKRR